MSFNEAAFKARLNTALKEVKKILDNARHPVIAEKREHGYDDKYLLASWAVNTSIASQLNVLVR